MVIAVYPGTFDPITKGHLDIIKRSKQFCDQLFIAIGSNPSKRTLFSVEERLSQINGIINNHLDFIQGMDVYAISFPGLLVSAAQSVGAKIMIRGIRTVSDFEYEITLANANKVLAPEIDTVFLPTSPHLAVVSSSAVKEIASHGGPIDHFVTPEIEAAVRAKLSEKSPK